MAEIRFELDDAMEIAVLQKEVQHNNEKIQAANQKISAIVSKYQVPQGAQLITSPRGYLIGANVPDAPPPAPPAPPDAPTPPEGGAEEIIH